MFVKRTARSFIAPVILEQIYIKLDVKLVKRVLLRLDDKGAVIMQLSLSVEPDSQLGQLPFIVLRHFDYLGQR